MNRIFRGTGTYKTPVGEIYQGTGLIYTGNSPFVIGYVRGEHLYQGYASESELVGSFEGDHIYRGYGKTRIPVGTYEDGIVYQGVGGSNRPRIGEADSIEGAAALLLLPLANEYHFTLGPKNGIPYAPRPSIGFGFKGILLILLSLIAWGGMFTPTILNDPSTFIMFPAVLLSVVLGMFVSIKLLKKQTFWALEIISALIAILPCSAACYLVDGKLSFEVILATAVMSFILCALPTAIAAWIYFRRKYPKQKRR